MGLAQLSEELGLDLVTFQDHPYQRSFLDTWTLMSYVAASTASIHIAPNVLNLPLRPPAVVARAAASLDLLSGGRFELGLGAGAFGEAMVAMGGPQRTPGEAVEALAEAMTILRELWDTSARGGVRVVGRHYTVLGAKRGPAPAHPIGIWLGAYKPRMLRLTGRVADGWLPSAGISRRTSWLPPTRSSTRRRRRPGAPRPTIRRLLQHQRRASAAEQRLPPGPAGSVGGTADEPGGGRRDRHLHPGHRRPGHDRAVRGGGRARRP